MKESAAEMTFRIATSARKSVLVVAENVQLHEFILVLLGAAIVVLATVVVNQHLRLSRLEEQISTRTP